MRDAATVASHHMLNMQILRMGLQAPQLTRGPTPCSCAYHMQYTRFTRPASIWARRVQSYSKVTATGFIIDPACVHHGDTRRLP